MAADTTARVELVPSAKGKATHKDKTIPSRHKQWLSRNRAKGTKATWRPKKLHRVASKHWLQNIDSQFRMMCEQPEGLKFFQKPEVITAGDGRWNDWRTWPSLIGGMDFGSDGLCASHGAQFEFHLNFEILPDQSHANNRSVYNTLKSVGVWPLMLLYVISMNLPHGPDREDWRHNQIKQHLVDLYQNYQPDEVPLFEAMAPDIIDAMKKNGHRLFTPHVS